MKSTEEQNNQQSNWDGKDLTTVPQKIVLMEISVAISPTLSSLFLYEKTHSPIIKSIIKVDRCNKIHCKKRIIKG